MTEITDAEYAAATERGEAARTSRPTPTSVHYDKTSGRIIVEFDNGAAFAFPARLLQGLEQTSDDDLADVELAGGTGVHWPRLDADFTISGLMMGVFGSKSFMDARKKGGQSRSPGKTAASRANGAKGGRPPKR
ncbi:DUF2442 domain-containing protein [Pararhizobium sp. BT-229]|uniref:DUF2442 domain-containing protein n=1 Tax=Pararhizobium sp. BT-229 TaxID=2986923 RepID=UPI0021F7DF39|nr:DUF2442 domain-containing protein [Pararhizobium sp. BT-229]MCV9964163.1 DUF2442 domain-containing protein [Pararhizobium sp. BT-229]